MNQAFDPARGLIVVRAELHGPSAEVGLNLALDTGASQTMVNVLPLTLAGYLLEAATEDVEITTGSGVAALASTVSSAWTLCGTDLHPCPDEEGIGSGKGRALSQWRRCGHGLSVHGRRPCVPGAVGCTIGI